MAGEDARNTCGHPDRPHCSKGLCRPCYNRQRKARNRKGERQRPPPHKVAPMPIPESGAFEYGRLCECAVKIVRFDGWITTCQFCSRLIRITA